MINAKVIIVGGGPAGSTCAWALKNQGEECIILDRQHFPRSKLCAGWITPQVLRHLQIGPDDYPHSLKRFDRFIIHVLGCDIKIKVHQYAIRRYEFDHWLVQRSEVPVHVHHVKSIHKEDRDYVIDSQYRCQFLVGAAGTFCPVYRTFFASSQPGDRKSLVVTLEQEFSYGYDDGNCHLWFAQNGLPGYSWYVPKGNGVVNVGIGGLYHSLKTNHDTLRRHWQLFVQQIQHLGLVKNFQFQPKGYVYYLRSEIITPQQDNIFLAGDALGLATQDMGEGIGAAVQSGLLIAEAISTGKPYSVSSIKKSSFPKVQPLIKLAKLITRI